MIFVTVGTHEQSFNRLIKYVDILKSNNLINEEVVIQIGYSTYIPKHCVWQKLYSYEEMLKLVEKARIVITHGGPSSFIMPLQINKTPIVVPRQKKYDEHVNDHQMEFAIEVSKRLGTIITIIDIEELYKTILDYDEIVNNININHLNNNKYFCEKLEEIVHDM